MRFTVLADMVAMMNKANVPRAIRYKLFGEVLMMTTKMNTLVIAGVNGVKKMRVEHYVNKMSL